MTGTPLKQVIARNVQRFRSEAGWTQGHLAAAAKERGLNWTRITVVEIEAARRRVYVEDLLVLAVVFEKSLVAFLLPPAGEEKSPVGITKSLAVSYQDMTTLIAEGTTSGGDPVLIRCRELKAQISEYEAQVKVIDAEIERIEEIKGDYSVELNEMHLELTDLGERLVERDHAESDES